ncbi:methyltransferase domain-containing protein [Vibrio diazotrophicus]|uniref:methyltransferase domain-containing protein n=1 Tax=Vibrio diazotrophicus TaxID=685 RepID=UPI00142D59A2|nr:class I SAM-dependent methyltransferase [Vibrio diazotrophicus]NIY94215.1 class I SAM-dependent methyltransferase [Vibrio diazotrophicus]
MENKASIQDEVSKYYNEKIEMYGQTPKGVDWNGEESQFLRFFQLSKLIPKNEFFTLNDIGCGYGSYYDYLSLNYKLFDYEGIDISPSMISSALDRNKCERNLNFILSNTPTRIADYSVASGIFNVKQDRSDSEWWEYLIETLAILDKYSKKGFSFNCLTSFSDKEKMKDYLYYANPMKIFEYCKINFSRNVSLFHDYDLYEFTLIVRK